MLILLIGQVVPYLHAIISLAPGKNLHPCVVKVLFYSVKEV